MNSPLLFCVVKHPLRFRLNTIGILFLPKFEAIVARTIQTMSLTLRQFLWCQLAHESMETASDLQRVKEYITQSWFRLPLPNWGCKGTFKSFGQGTRGGAGSLALIPVNLTVTCL